jgi:hypothetical protein
MVQDNVSVQIQTMRIRKQLFNAHFGYLTVEQVADVRLVVIKKHGKFGPGCIVAAGSASTRHSGFWP